MTGQHSSSEAQAAPIQPRRRMLAAGRVSKVGRWVLGSDSNEPTLSELERADMRERLDAAIPAARRRTK